MELRQIFGAVLAELPRPSDVDRITGPATGWVGSVNGTRLTLGRPWARRALRW